MNRAANNPSRTDFDVVIVGGGLSGQLVLHALAAQAPKVTVALIDGRDSLQGNQTWCCHGADLVDGEPGPRHHATLAWFLPLVERRWRQHQVRFPRYDRMIDGDYLCLRSSALARATARIMRRPETVLFSGTHVSRVGDDQVTLSSGRVLRGKVVVDARGAGSDAFAGRTGYQKFLGFEIEASEVPAGFATQPILMDATVAQRDGFRFFYVLPFSRSRFLVEETFFSSTPDFSKDESRARVRAYLAERGVRDFTVAREESAILPMPWAKGDLADPLAIGYRGGFFHPATGYSLGQAVQVAQRIALSIAQSGPARAPVAETLRDLRKAHRRDHRFARILNFLAFRLIPGAQRRDLVMSAVYRMSESLLARFYAGRQTGWDRLAMLLATARLLPSAPISPRPLIGENP
jgi:lycopene beta-cyclase